MRVEFEMMPVGPVRLTCRTVGVFFLFSALVYAFAGIPTWSPLEAHDMRAFVLILVHAGGIAAFVLSFFYDESSYRRAAKRQVEEAITRADKQVEGLRNEVAQLRQGLTIKTEERV